MATRNDRVSLVAGQDGGTPLKTARVHSPAVAVPHPAFYANSAIVDQQVHYGVPANYEAVIRKLAAAGDFQHDQQQRGFTRDVREAEFAQQQQRTLMLGQNPVMDRESNRPQFSSSPHPAAMFHQHISPYASPRPAPPPATIQDSGASASKRPRLMSDFAQPLRIDVDARRDNMPGSSAYKPQVEAISPTLPVDDLLGNQIRHARDELVQNINRVDREITGIEHTIEKLKRKQQQLEEEAKKPVEERTAEPDLNIDVRNQMSVVQTIHADNKKKAEASHAQLAKLGKATLLPLYIQPSDTTIYHQNKAKFATFKKPLMQYLKRRQKATQKRENYWAEKYEKLLQAWVKRLDKVENNLKRRMKDAKAREVFEKIFPELKKQREDKERLQRVSCTRFGGYVRSEANIEQIVDGLHEQEEEERKMRSLAVIPPMMLDARQRQLRYINENGLIDDPIPINMEMMSRSNYWTSEEKELFREKYLQRPKNFGFISAAIENKTSEDCVLFYYSSKKSANYKQMVRRHNVSSRKRKFRTPAAATAAAAQAAREQLKEEKPESAEPEAGNSFTEEKKPLVDTIEKPRGIGDGEDELYDETCLSTAAEPQNTPDCGDEHFEDKVDVLKIDDKDVLAVDPESAEDARLSASDGEVETARPASNCAPPVISTPPERPGSCAQTPSGAFVGNDSVNETPNRTSESNVMGDGPPPAMPRLDVSARSDDNRRSTDINSMNVAGMTAAHLIEAIIAQETARDTEVLPHIERPRTGSHTSLCSDNTSDTLSADEGQREDDDQQQQHRKSRSEEEPRSGVVQSLAMDTAEQQCTARIPQASVASISKQVANSTLFPALYLPNAGRDGLGVIPSLRDPLSADSRLLGLSPQDGGTLMAGQRVMQGQAKTMTAALLGLDKVASSKTAATLRVRDVIHNAIEENLLLRGPDLPGPGELLRLCNDQSSMVMGSRSTNAVHGNALESPTDLAQDLSCRNRDRGMPGGKDVGNPMQRSWTPDVGQFTGKSPPPAHSHYARQAAVPPLPPVNRHDDPLYHLAEVAVQRSRVEVAADRHRASPAPTMPPYGPGTPRHGIPSLRENDNDMLAHPHVIGGSITHGTPRHLATAMQDSRLPSVPLPRSSVVYGMSPSQPSSRPPDNGPPVPQAMELAQQALKYLGQPGASQRAVMEQVMAAVSGGQYNISQSSHNILMGDYMTAQQMQNSQQQSQPSVPPRHRNRGQPAESRVIPKREGVPSPLPRLDPVTSASRFPRAHNEPVLPKHASAVQANRSLMPERPPPPVVPASSPLAPRRPLTAANVIDAIITHQINKDAPSSDSVGLVGSTILNRLPDIPPHRTMNGTAAVDGNVALPPPDARQNVNERLEMERIATLNSQRAMASRVPDLSRNLSVSSSAGHAGSTGTGPTSQPPVRSFTLGEHIDEMIQKDFGLPTAAEFSQSGNAESSKVGLTIDANTKNALRTFLTSSSDFNSDLGTRQRESSMSNRINSPKVPETGQNDNRRSPATLTPRQQRDSFERDARSGSSSSVFLNTVMQKLTSSQPEILAQRMPGHSSPVTSAIPSQARVPHNGSTIQPGLLGSFPMVTSSSLAMNTLALLSMTSGSSPFALAASSPVSSATVGTSGLAALFGAISPRQLGVPNLLSAAVASSMVSTVSSSQPSGISKSFLSNISMLTPVSSNAEMNGSEGSHPMAYSRASVAVDSSPVNAVQSVQPADHQDMPSSGMNWKLKMARDHQRQEQEREQQSQQTSAGSQPDISRAPRSRPSSRPMTPADGQDMAALARARLGMDVGHQPSSTGPALMASDVLVGRSLGPPFGQAWLAGSGSREASSEGGSCSSKSVSPRSPRTLSQLDKPLSSIAASHQTMSTLLSIKPNFSMEKVIGLEGVDSKCAVSSRPPSLTDGPTTPLQSAVTDIAHPSPASVHSSSGTPHANTPAPVDTSVTPSADTSGVSDHQQQQLPLSIAAENSSPSDVSSETATKTGGE